MCSSVGHSFFGIFERIYRGMRRIVLMCLIALCATGAFATGEGEVRELSNTVKYDGMTREQIFSKVSQFVVTTFNAEIAYADSTVLLVYIQSSPKNCVGVIYTMKFLFQETECTYSIYFAATPRDNTTLCRQNISDEIVAMGKVVDTIFK